jgi:ureidoglycolate lyase
VIRALAPDAARFAPFGAFVAPPGTPGERRLYSDWLAPAPGRALQFHVNHVAPSALPLRLDRVERHPRAAQVFLPLDVARYVVTVLPGGADGAPDPAGALAVEVPGTLGVVYRPGVWHAGMTVLDRPGAFAVLMWRGTAGDDDDFAAIAPLTIDLSRLPVPSHGE